ncbi:MAG: extracellular solute-binding protein [Anaerolineae bacterium]|nr:extracellular solute-binding protein [Anaerolineae bacterium]
MGQLVSSGLLAPVDLGDKADLFTEVGLTGCTYEGQLYCIPYAQENLAFFYNTDLVAEAPATWDEVVEVGTALMESGDATYGFALTGTTYDAFPLNTAFGGYIFGRDDAGNYNPQDLGVDNEGMIAAGQWMADQVEAGFMPNTTDWDTAHVLFETGEIPFLMAGPWALDRIRTSGVPYAISTFPEGPAGQGAPFAGVQGFFVNALGENPLLAQAFLSEFVATEEVMQALYDTGQRPSAFISVLEATEDPDIASFGEAGANAVLMPAIPEMGSVWGSWGDAVTLILNGEQTADEALTTGAAQIRELVAGAAAGMVNVPGSWQAAADIGCGDWDPACEGSALAAVMMVCTPVPSPCLLVIMKPKSALDGGWTTNYGVDGKADGDNYTFSLAADGTVTFTFDPDSHILTIETE